MSVNYSYPGIYVQELPLDTRSISPAPTSIAAFVGYTHPYKTVAFNAAVPLFSFTDYEANFGGLYTSGNISSDVARAVYEFFQNGGTTAYVVGLQPNAYDGGNPPTVLGKFGLPPFGSGAAGGFPYIVSSAQIPTDGANGMYLTALEPTDVVPMTARVANIRASNPSASVYDTFDLIIAYGTRIETYRNIGLGFASGTNSVAAINKVSSLITMQPLTPGGSCGNRFASPDQLPPFALTATLSGFVTGFNPGDFIPAFEANSSLDQIEILNLLLIPGVADNIVVSAALSFAERKRAFVILDPPAQAPAFGPGSIDTVMSKVPISQNGAIYFPYLLSTDPVTTNPIAVPPSGFVAGIYASTDISRGVWKAPAGIATSLLGTVGPVASGVMNNCLRTFSGAGTVVYGARTLVAADTAFAQSKYVPVRRMVLFIEQTLTANLKWVVFEPNDEPLWIAIRTSIEAFLLSLFNQKALQGSTPSQAFQVKCDSTTTTRDDQANGIVNIVVAVALLKPAEFVVIKIAQIAGQTAS
jgi:phage tail sheath protein FI